MKKNKSKRRRSTYKGFDVDGIIHPTKEVITAKHWLPDFKEQWDKEGDVRARITLELDLMSDDSTLCPDGFVIEDAVVMNPEKPDPVKVIGSNWIHADVHGVMTEETFFKDLTKCIVEFADMIIKEQNPFQPVRLYKDAEAAYGIGFFDWTGDEFPFDIRSLCQFGSWEFTSDKNEKVVAAGFRFWLGTLVLPTKNDADIHVGKDMAKAVYGDDIDA